MDIGMRDGNVKIRRVKRCYRLERKDKNNYC